MNKFFAMLKDSYREAVDGWIFLVLLILSGLLILLVLSASAEPEPYEQAIGTMMNAESMTMVSPDRGQDTHQAQFFYRVSAGKYLSPAPADLWSGEMNFTVTVDASGPIGGVEVDAEGKPKKPVEGAGLFSDPFSSAVRYWAAAAGTPLKERPKFTPELASDFLRNQITQSTGLNVSEVKKVADNEYEVSAKGVASRNFWPHSPRILFGAFTIDMFKAPLGRLVYRVENTLLNGIGAWVLMLAGVIVTAAFVPNMLRKGAIDLLITKPMGRTSILLYKYLGGLLFVFLICSITVGGIWVVIGLRTGIWATGVLWTIPGITFYFAILYACSTLFGVLSRNAIVCIVVTIVFWFVLYLIGLGHNIVVGLDNTDFSEMRQMQKSKAKKDPDKKNEAADDEPPIPDMKPNPILVKVMKALNTVTPRANDLDALTTEAIGKGLLSNADQRIVSKAAREVNTNEALAVSFIWIGLFLGFAILRFNTRSY
ncbi:hypothetical protein BH11PLA2_BH11PLA2_12280 [soil metagenome]